MKMKFCDFFCFPDFCERDNAGSSHVLRSRHKERKPEAKGRQEAEIFSKKISATCSCFRFPAQEGCLKGRRKACSGTDAFCLHKKQIACQYRHFLCSFRPFFCTLSAKNSARAKIRDSEDPCPLPCKACSLFRAWRSCPCCTCFRNSGHAVPCLPLPNADCLPEDLLLGK